MSITKKITSISIENYPKEATLILRLKHEEENLLNPCSKSLSLSMKPFKEERNDEKEK